MSLSAEPVNNPVGPEHVTKAVPPEPTDNTKAVPPEPTDNTKAAPPEPTDNTRSCVPEPISDAASRIRDDISTTISSAADWCRNKYYKHRLLFTVLPKLVSLLLYVFDLGTDIFTAVQHFANGHPWWGSFTVIFTILPMVSLSTGLIVHTSQNSGDSMDNKLLPSLSAIVCSPIVPFGWLVLDLVASFSNTDPENENNDNPTAENANVTYSAEDISVTIAEDASPSSSGNTKGTAAEAARLIKLFVTVVEAYPQAALQIYIVFQQYILGDAIEIWQWITITTSLLSLAFAISTGYLNDIAAISSKAVFLFFGLLAIGTRLVVCCVYSMLYSPLWFVPFFIELVASTIVWIVSFVCQRDDEGHHIGSQGKCAGVLIFVLTEGYNGFTLSGLLISGINLVFAVGGHFLDNFVTDTSAAPIKEPIKPVAIAATTLAAVSVAANIMFITLPYFKGVREDWMKKPKVEEVQI